MQLFKVILSHTSFKSFLCSLKLFFRINCLGHEKIVRALIELGAKVNAEDNNKETPLHRAADWGNSFIYLRSMFLVFIVFFPAYF